jgi:hypothetical protein
MLLAVLTGCGAALSRTAYQAELTTTSTAIDSALEEVAKAEPFQGLADQLNQAQTVVTDAADRLEQITPPDSVSAVNAELVEGMRELANDLVQLADEVISLQLCTTPSVMASLSNKESVERLRAAVARLASGPNGESYSWGEFLPQAVAQSDRRLPTGHLVLDHRSTGENQLEVNNDAEQDAVVTLAQGGRSILSVYVGSKQKFTADRIGDGTYDIYFTSGTDWDEQLRAFTRTCEFARFDEPTTFVSTRSGNTIYYRIWQISLMPRIGGNAPVSQVDPKDFPKLSPVPTH